MAIKLPRERQFLRLEGVREQKMRITFDSNAVNWYFSLSLVSRHDFRLLFHFQYILCAAKAVKFDKNCFRNKTPMFLLRERCFFGCDLTSLEDPRNQPSLKLFLLFSRQFRASNKQRSSPKIVLAKWYLEHPEKYLFYRVLKIMVNYHVDPTEISSCSLNFHFVSQKA